MNPYQKVAFHTLGCKLNFAETSTLGQELQAAGYAKVAFTDQPDVFVINTCSVTENADKECSYWVRKALKVNPNARIVIVGCYAQLKPQIIEQIPGVDLVLGAQEKFALADYLEKMPEKGKPLTAVGPIKAVKDFFPSYTLGDRTRSFLKVQDGCDYFCAFCTIPLARGRSRSANIQATFEKAKELEEKGAIEIVLTGVNVGDFGVEHGENLLGLIQKINTLKNVQRFRISSIEPNLITKEIINFVAENPRWMPHFHIPMQSGSETILTQMRRKYKASDYAEKINYIHQKLPDAGIGADVIVGFPFETQELFLETAALIESLPLSYLHVFTYSERAQTTAIKWAEGKVEMAERKLRNKKLQMISLKKSRAFYSNFLGTEREILVENDHQGYTDNYIPVQLPENTYQVGKVIKGKLVGFSPNDNSILAI